MLDANLWLLLRIVHLNIISFIIISTNERTNERTGFHARTLLRHQCIVLNLIQRDFSEFFFSFFGLGIVLVCECVFVCMWRCVIRLFEKGLKREKKSYAFVRQYMFMYVVVIALTRSGISNFPLFFWVVSFPFHFLFFAKRFVLFFWFLNQSRVRELRAVSSVLFWLVFRLCVSFFTSIGTGDCICVCVSGWMISIL